MKDRSHERSNDDWGLGISDRGAYPGRQRGFGGVGEGPAGEVIDRRHRRHRIGDEVVVRNVEKRSGR